jgi:NADH:ubiquinone oxidoreductase subunit 3 (subunit A)
MKLKRKQIPFIFKWYAVLIFLVIFIINTIMLFIISENKNNETMAYHLIATQTLLTLMYLSDYLRFKKGYFKDHIKN